MRNLIFKNFHRKGAKSAKKINGVKGLRPLLFPLFSFLLLGLLSCPRQEPTLSAINLPKYKFVIAEALDADSGVCPICLRPVFSCEIKSTAGKEFDSALGAVLAEDGFEMIRARLPADKSIEKKTVDPWLPLAKTLKGNFLVFPVIYCWSERKGSGLAVSSPAEVGFHLHLFDPESGKEVWGGNFNERQAPLSENLLDLNEFIKHGGKWVKAGELGEEGLEKLIREFLKAIRQNDSDSSH